MLIYFAQIITNINKLLILKKTRVCVCVCVSFIELYLFLRNVRIYS